MRTIIDAIVTAGAAALLLLASGAHAQDAGEQQLLMERKEQLKVTIETLKRDQDFLIFQQEMRASDSKYLIIKNAAKTGQLRYKNRVLKDFHFSASERQGALKGGGVALSKKIEDARGRQALIFDDALILLGKRISAAPAPAGVPRVLLSKKDFQSVFYAVERGARLYILP